MNSIEQRLEQTEEELKKTKKELKQLSPALELVQDLKKQKKDILSLAKMVYAYAIVMSLLFAGLLGYTIWLLNDIQVIETTEETYDMSTENGNNNYVGGSNNGEIINN